MKLHKVLVAQGMAESEERIFERWRASLPYPQRAAFVTDGLVDAVEYVRSSLKVLLLLKEVNDLDGGGWCLRNFLREKGGRPQTWDTVTRWLSAIRNLPKVTSWSEIEKVSKTQRIAHLRRIAVMNLKKLPGHHTTDLKAWWPVLERDKKYIKQQFKLYSADLVVCCGSDVARAFDAYLRDRDSAEWQCTSRGIKYLEYANGRYVVAYCHPEARVASNLIHFGLLDALQEIFCSTSVGQRVAT